MFAKLIFVILMPHDASSGLWWLPMAASLALAGDQKLISRRHRTYEFEGLLA